MTRFTSSLLLILLPLVTTAGLAAADDPPPELAPQMQQAASEEMGGLLDGRLGFGAVGEDYFVTINVGTAFHWSKLGVGVQIPLRLRVVDEAPETDSVFREEDWDEVSDWTRVLRYVSWGAPDEWLYARLGVLQGTSLGHGTIVDQYYNVIDADHYQTGVQVHLDLDVAGGQLFLDNLIDPELLGLRGYVRPFQFVASLPAVLSKFAIGTTLVTDFSAPLEPELDELRQNRVVDEDGYLAVKTTQVFLWGLDLGWEFSLGDWGALTPYADFNILGTTGGMGFHVGILSSFNIADVVRLGSRIEYRAMDDDYAPNYVNSWYEVERVDFVESLTKIRYFQLKDEDGVDDTVHGWHASLDVTILDAVTVAARMEDYEGPNNSNLMIRLVLPYISGFKVGAYYAKRNFDEASEVFDLDRALLVAEMKYKFWGPMFAYGLYSREWHLNKDTSSPDYGRYETINDFDFGIGAEFSF
jgi:hypothetical protein